MGSGVDWAVQDVDQLRQWLVDGRKPREMRALRPDWSLEEHQDEDQAAASRCVRRIPSAEKAANHHHHSSSPFSIHPYFIDDFSFVTPHQTRIYPFPAVFFFAIFMSSEPPVDPKTVQNLRGQLRNDFRVFDILEGFGLNMLTVVMVKPGLIVKRFGA